MTEINSLPMTGSKQIDAEHTQLYQHFETISGYIHKDTQDEDAISVALTNLISDLRKHFEHEENMMREASYSGLGKHHRDHIKILNEVQLTIMHWRRTKDNQKLSHEIESHLPQWLHDHILKRDLELVQSIT